MPDPAEPTEPTNEFPEVPETDAAEIEVAEADADSGSEDFDPSALERTYGLPAGSLSNAKDTESAVELVRTYVDKSLVEGFLSKVGKSASPPDDPAPAAPQKSTEQNPLEKRIAELEVKLTAGERAQRERQDIEFKRRLLARIDSWGSPKYGVGDQRRLKQIEATRALAARVLEAVGTSDVSIEQLADRIRVWDDDNVVPTAKAKPAGTVGSPGAGSPSAKKTGQPANIYEALAQNWDNG